ncbi:hypothetical protein P9112_002285 [Eukaryota sp. TZLM1-RC]
MSLLHRSLYTKSSLPVDSDTDSDACLFRLNQRSSLLDSDSDYSLHQHSLSLSSSGSSNSSFHGNEALSPSLMASSPFTPLNITKAKKQIKLSATDISAPPTPFPSSYTPSSTNHYIKGKIIGRGSSGCVYECLDIRNGTFVACKEVFSPVGSHGTINREASMLAALDHPNIISYYDIAIEKEKVLIYQELASTNLANVVKSFGKLPLNIVISWSRQLLFALDYLHNTKHTVHRDIKLSNVFLTNCGTIKLGDFGSAALTKTLNNTGGLDTLIGTPCFMAPEVVRQEKYGRRSDVFSFGAVVYSLVTGTVPWEEKFSQKKSVISVLYDIAHSSQSPSIPKDVDPQIANLLLQMMARNPNDRPTVKQLLDHALFC